ncbi:MAG: glyoxylate/hydroxypyruvate reductase A [Pseudomonadota bacterium]
MGSIVAIIVDGWAPEEWADALNRQAPDLEVRIWPDIDDPGAVDFALVWKPPAGVLTDLPNLKAIFSLGAGVDHVLGGADNPGVPLARIVDPDLTHRMSEYIVLHCLIILRKQRLFDVQQREASWHAHAMPLAAEVRVGILGYGTLGQDAATKLATIGFDVAGWSRTAKPQAPHPVFHGAAMLKPFLARTDILVSLLPLTPDTRGFLNAGIFDCLAREGALGEPALINVGRGASQNEADMLSALDSGVLGHAVLDVFETEPLPPENPLWHHPKVTLTPHVAADSTPEGLTRLIVSQIRRAERGEPLLHLVDRKRGY